MTTWSKTNLLKKTVGVKIHKSFRDAINSITESLEKQHFEVSKKLKNAVKLNTRGSR